MFKVDLEFKFSYFTKEMKYVKLNLLSQIIFELKERAITWNLRKHINSLLYRPHAWHPAATWWHHT